MSVEVKVTEHVREWVQLEVVVCGKVYYYNTATKQVEWDRPAAMGADPNQHNLPEGLLEKEEKEVQPLLERLNEEAKKEDGEYDTWRATELVKPSVLQAFRDSNGEDPIGLLPKENPNASTQFEEVNIFDMETMQKLHWMAGPLGASSIRLMKIWRRSNTFTDGSHENRHTHYIIELARHSSKDASKQLYWLPPITHAVRILYHYAKD